MERDNKTQAAQDTTQSVANNISPNGISKPAMSPLPETLAAEDPLGEAATADAALQEPLVMDMDEDGKDEMHILFIHPEDGTLWLHSDAQTLSLFLKRKRRKALSVKEQALLKEIEDTAVIVHTGKYGTKGTSTVGKAKRKAPTVQDRQQAQLALKKIAVLLGKLNQLTSVVMKKLRPPSHQAQLLTKTIGPDTFCAKIVMEPLSILGRDDGIVGSTPQEETKLWKRLTNIAGYKRGHMLNDHLHGPGTNNNLVPISTAFNSTMKVGVEKAAKDAVNANNKVVRFEAEALNWGSFAGAFGYPDEQALPANFHFKVTQMKLIPGNDGSQVSHWQEDTTIKPIYDKTLPHDIPVDVVPGVVANTVKNFVPGFYFHSSGTIKPTTTPNTYHLLGNFSINSQSSLLRALAMDDKGNLPYNYIAEKVLTVYQVPPGYHIVLPYPATELEYIEMDKIRKYTTSTPAFLIVNTAKEAKLKGDFEEEKKQVLKKEEEKKQQVLSQKAKEQKEKEEREERERLKREKDEEEALQRKKNDEYRHELLKRVRLYGQKYETKFNDAFLEQFIHYREKILYDANNKWKEDEQLFNRDMEGLLDPIRAQLLEVKDKVLARQEKQEIIDEQQRQQDLEIALQKEQIINELLGQLQELVEQEYLPNLASDNAISYFKKEVNKIFNYYGTRWEEKSDLIKADKKQLLSAAKESLDKAFGVARKLVGKPNLKKTGSNEQRREERPRFIPNKRKREDTNEEQTETPTPKDGPFRFTDTPPFEDTSRTQTPPPFSLHNTLPFNAPPQHNYVPPNRNEPPHVVTAREIWSAATRLYYQYNGNQFLQSHLWQLELPMQAFTSQPTANGWYTINKILLQLEQVNELNGYARRWIDSWQEVKPQ
ncbi:MAG TPA: hypothetical protein VIM87_13250 [Chitinophaga sp.]|uniref:hypothetical protein n=1 Tax=Chitinophaga sp. TaxID=1869181 RepID=UPI002F949341